MGLATRKNPLHKLSNTERRRPKRQAGDVTSVLDDDTGRFAQE